MLVLIAFFIFVIYFSYSKKTILPDVVLKLDGGTFDTEVNVIITEDTSIARKFVTYHLNVIATSEDFNGEGATFVDDDNRIAIWLQNANNKGVVQHELLHATVSIMLWAGIPFSNATEESYAYQLQYLTNQFNSKIK
jgi:hypothetical protein